MYQKLFQKRGAMQDRRYLLSLKNILEECAEEQDNCGQLDMLRAKACRLLDAERLKKLEHIKSERKQLESIGAGLLLQLAVWEALAGQEIKESQASEIVQLSFAQLLERFTAQREPIPLEYTYGSQGKPYLKNVPYYFSISHSGDYVLCVLSKQEVGADIQQKMSNVNERILRRFFSPEEKNCWEQCDTETEKRDFFYQMWCRKEAYGKLTGEGISGAVSVNMCDKENEYNAVIWKIEEYAISDDYQIAICKWK